MLKLIDLIITKTVNLVFPVPILKEVVGEALCRYKLQFLSVLLVILSLPLVVIGSALTMQPTISQYTTEDEMKRQYFDRQYSVKCRDGKDSVGGIVVNYECEVRPEFASELDSQNINDFCKIDPTKCRAKRPKIDCTKTPERCETATSGEGENATSTIRPKAGEEEKYYQEQQTTEENSQNIFSWLGSAWNALFGNGGNSNGNGGQIGATGITGTPQNVVGIPNSLKDYIEPDILDSGTPNGNPFGGGGYNWVTIGCVYLCGGYGYNNGNHLGLDMNPLNTNTYKANSRAYAKTGQAIVMATCSGNARSTSELYGGNYVIIKCKDTPYYVIFIHLSAQFVPSEGVSITAGQPVGVMGSTGRNTTGPHLHYQIGTCEQYVISCTLNPDRFLGG